MPNLTAVRQSPCRNCGNSGHKRNAYRADRGAVSAGSLGIGREHQVSWGPRSLKRLHPGP
jgi:hypothetical protein